jgi:predicted DNA-binding ArsR family transcriptional regulator
LGAGLLGLLAFTSEKLYVFKFTDPQINYRWQNLEAIKLMMDQSALPHNQVKQAVGAINSLQKDMRTVLTIDTTAQSIK